MLFSDFKIGGEFICAERRWRCTDIGTRVIVAICLEPTTVGSVTLQNDKTLSPVTYRQDNDPSWFNGPPYAVCETVFDEYDIPACTLTE